MIKNGTLRLMKRMKMKERILKNQKVMKFLYQIYTMILASLN